MSGFDPDSFDNGYEEGYKDALWDCGCADCMDTLEYGDDDD
jgi:hypothetical protein